MWRVQQGLSISSRDRVECFVEVCVQGEDAPSISVGLICQPKKNVNQVLVNLVFKKKHVNGEQEARGEGEGCNCVQF